MKSQFPQFFYKWKLKTNFISQSDVILAFLWSSNHFSRSVFAWLWCFQKIIPIFLFWNAMIVIFVTISLQIYQWECSAEAVTADLVCNFFNLFENKTICNFYGSTEMMDITYTAFTSLTQLEAGLYSD